MIELKILILVLHKIIYSNDQINVCFNSRSKWCCRLIIVKTLLRNSYLFKKGKSYNLIDFQSVLLLISQAGLYHCSTVRSCISITKVRYPIFLEFFHLLLNNFRISCISIRRSPKDHTVEDYSKRPNVTHLGILLCA